VGCGDWLAVGKPLEGHTSWVCPLLTLPMGATSSPDLMTRRFECGMRRLDWQSASLSRGTLDWVWSVAYSPDGRHIISGSDDKTIRMWDAETGLAVGKPLEGHTGSPVGVVRCLLSRWAPHHLRILRQDDSNVGCGDWIGSRQASRGAHWLGVVRCLLSRWAPHHLRIVDLSPVMKLVNISNEEER
jgi:WD40 repeat protein